MGCGGDGASCPGPFEEGGDGHADPLHAGPGEARAGRIHAADLPVVPSGMITWKDGDFVLANDKVALVIEDVGDSDLYDPWGGRPVGLARVEGGKLVEPNNFGEMFILTGRSTVLTDSVSVINDGSDGKPAIVRARGKLHPMPFLESLLGVVYPEAWTDIDAAIDYELAPGSEHVDIRMRYASARDTAKELPTTLHALMYTKRTPAFQPVKGFDAEGVSGAPWLALIDDKATSWGYIPGNGNLTSSVAASGFLGAFTDGFTMPACGTLDRLHGQIVIGGPGLDGVVAAIARTRGEAQREITGTVTRAGVPAAGIRVHAIDIAGGTDSYITRATTDANGAYSLHVPTGANIRLDAFVRGTPIVSQLVAAGTTGDIDLPAVGAIHVVATDGGEGVPVRVQIVPGAGQTVVDVPVSYGEPQIATGRVHIAFSMTGDVTLPVVPGTWDVIVSRGYEYEVERVPATVTAGATKRVDIALDHSIDTTGALCGDFHVHTWRSNDSGDDGIDKVSQAVADGVELPIRSDHEYVANFAAEIAQLGIEKFAASIGSIELTSMEVWGHMGVFPLDPDPTQINGGAPKWQTFPTADKPDTPFETLSPVKVFDAVRARPEAPIVIINHPRGPTNYFGYVGYDPATGTASSVADWDTKFTLVEVFNDSGWQQNRKGTVDDWLGMLRAGRKVFAVGSSDSHGISYSPVGYPRTCVALGTDDPRQITPNLVRDKLAAGHAIVSGGIFVSAKLGTAGPGDTTTGAGSPQNVDVVVQAPTWVDVTTIEVIVDGMTVDTIPVMPGDADAQNPAIRWRGTVPVQVRASGGFIVIAAFGAKALEPVHPGRMPFGMTNPIFVVP